MTEQTSLGPRAARLLIAAGILLTLLVIALYVRDSVIRPYGGDLLVAAFLYFGLRGMTLWTQDLCAAAAFAVAVIVEVAQGGGLIGQFGLEDSSTATALLGTTFDPLDLIMYALGIGVSVWLDRP